MLIRHAIDFLYLCPLIKCNANYALSSLKVLMELGINLLNHTLMGPFSVFRKVQYMISFAIPCKCLRVLNDFR